MPKLVTMIFGAAVGAAGTAAWLLSTPESSASTSPAGTSASDCIEQLRTRWQSAVEVGKQAGADTENRLKHELEADRRHPDRPGTSL